MRDLSSRNYQGTISVRVGSGRGHDHSIPRLRSKEDTISSIGRIGRDPLEIRLSTQVSTSSERGEVSAGAEPSGRVISIEAKEVTKPSSILPLVIVGLLVLRSVAMKAIDQSEPERKEGSQTNKEVSVGSSVAPEVTAQRAIGLRRVVSVESRETPRASL